MISTHQSLTEAVEAAQVSPDSIREGAECSVSGCGNAAQKKMLCTKHYTRLIRHGSPTGGGKERGHAQKWIRSHVGHSGEECLIWPFYRDKRGYARISFEGRDQVASRIMCRLAHGEPPSDRHEAAHSCGMGEKGCVNPRHLRWATPHENNMDKVLHGTSSRGEKSWNSALTRDQVCEIRALISQGVSQRKIAPRFGVSQGTISSIATRKTWGWLQ